MTAFRLLVMLCFGWTHHPCVVTRPVFTPDARSCALLGAAMVTHLAGVPERAMSRFTAHAEKVTLGRMIAQCVVH